MKKVCKREACVASERFSHLEAGKRYKGCDGAPARKREACVASERFFHLEVGKRYKKAWVVFSDDTDLAWLRFLKPGFRHCFVLLHDGQHWVSVDPLSNYMEVLVHHLPAAFDLPSWLRNRGQYVVAAPLCRTIQKAAPLGVFSCVEAVKRILGLHKRFILTPWQLYRFLYKNYPHIYTQKSNIKAKGESKNGKSDITSKGASGGNRVNRSICTCFNDCVSGAKR